MAEKDKKIEVKYFKNTVTKAIVSVASNQYLPTPYKEISLKEFQRATGGVKKPQANSNKPAVVQKVSEPPKDSGANSEPTTDNLSEWKKYALTIKGIKDADVKDLKIIDEIKELIKLAK